MATTTVNILRVLDDVAPSTGVVPSGSATDDTMPTVQIGLGSGAQAGDYVQLFMDDGTRPGVPVALTSTDIANGYVSITSSQPMPDGAHALTARYIDQAGTQGPASAPDYVFTEAGSGTAQQTPLTDGGYVITWRPSSGPDVYAQKYSSAGMPVGPQFHYHSDVGFAPGVKAVALSNAGYAIAVGSSRVDLQACKLEYSIVSPK